MRITLLTLAISVLVAADQTLDKKDVQDPIVTEQKCGNFGIPCSIEEKVIKEVNNEDWEKLKQLKEFEQ